MFRFLYSNGLKDFCYVAIPAMLVSLVFPASLHAEQKAHVHGHATLAIAFDNLSGKIEFEAPADALLGFERSPKSAKEKKTLAEMCDRFAKEVQNWIQLDPSLQCQYKSDRIELETSGEHADFVAIFSLTCKTAPLGSTIKIDFSGFSKIKKLEVTVLAGEIQKSETIKGAQVKTIELK